jgi:hypothetical protein
LFSAATIFLTRAIILVVVPLGMTGRLGMERRRGKRQLQSRPLFNTLWNIAEAEI